MALALPANQNSAIAVYPSLYHLRLRGIFLCLLETRKVGGFVHGSGKDHGQAQWPVPVEAPEGSIELVDVNGTPYDLTGKTAFSLCRCGGSVNKPFCDGTHSRIGFQGAELAVKKAEGAFVEFLRRRSCRFTGPRTGNASQDHAP